MQDLEPKSILYLPTHNIQRVRHCFLDIISILHAGDIYNMLKRLRATINYQALTKKVHIIVQDVNQPF